MAVTPLSTLYILAFVTFRKTLQLVTLLVSCVFWTICWEIFLIGPKSILCEIESVFEKKKKKKKKNRTGRGTA